MTQYSSCPFARRVARVAAVAALLGAAAAPARAQYFGRNRVQYERFDFRLLSTPHFDLHYYRPAEPQAQGAGRQAERWYARHSAFLGHTFDRRPLVVYANIPDFLQTNVTDVGNEGTGGVTLGNRERVVYRFTGVPADDDHVLGHELVHVFQYDIALRDAGARGMQSLGSLPLWLVEGMAEYLSIGRSDPNTAMWLRDAALRNKLPTIKQLTTDPRFFPYRYGQALWAYVGATYGDQAVAAVFRRSLREGYERGFRGVLGISTDSLSKAWIARIKSDYPPAMAARTAPREVGQRVQTTRGRDGDYNLGPVLSPDGRTVALFSSRGLFGIELFLADAQTGRVIRRLTDVTTDEHLDAVSFLYSAGTFSPDGRQFAYVVYADGDNELRIVDVRTGRQRRRLKPEGVDAMTTLAWSPDGRSIAIAGQRGAVGDLFLLDVASGDVRQLTNDGYADLQPAWSPDGRTLAFASDRPGTDFDRLSYQPVRISFLDVATGAVRTPELFAADAGLDPRLTAGTHAINPQFSPDGASVYFVADRGGFQDVYRSELATGRLFQVTRVATGVSGVASLSPALTVSRGTGRVMFSLFERQGYQVYGLDPARAAGTPVTAAEQLARAGSLPPVGAADASAVTAYLADPLTGLPPAGTAFPSSDYDPRFGLEAVGQPTIGVTTGSAFGTMVGGGVSALFTDLLGERNVGAVLQAQGSARDIGGQVVYQNVARRWQWGVGAGRIPYLSGFVTNEAVADSSGAIVAVRNRQILQHVFSSQLSGSVQYPFSTTRRFELNAMATRLSYYTEAQTYVTDGFSAVNEGREQLQSPDPLTYGQVAAAFVGDNSFGGFTSPIAGYRYRLEYAPVFGGLNFQTALADYRRYFFVRPLTLALRGIHYGRYGQDEVADENLYPLYLGEGTLVRGYEYSSVLNECSRAPTVEGCSTFRRLLGNRIAVVSAELRVPLLGPEELGLIRFGFLPLEVSPFVDAGVAWSESEAPTLAFRRNTDARVPVISTGLSLRTNLLGFAIVEAYYVYPFQRPGEGAHWGLQLAPGW
jgi:hypothetical protein